MSEDRAPDEQAHRPQIDPPLGWQCGFPKDIPSGVDRDAFLANLDEWLLANGYPQSFLDMHGGSVAGHCRIIGEWP